MNQICPVVNAARLDGFLGILLNLLANSVVEVPEREVKLLVDPLFPCTLTEPKELPEKIPDDFPLETIDVTF